MKVFFKMGSFCPGLGDAITFVSAVRSWAEFNQKQAVVTEIPLIVAKYDDNIIETGRKGEREINVNVRHRGAGAELALNYLGTWRRALEMPPDPTAAIHLPWTLYDTRKPYVALQPKSNFAANPQQDYVQSLVDQTRRLIGMPVFAVGKTNTNQSLKGIDYRFLSDDPTVLVRIIANASVLLAPRSASAHVASAYDTPSFIWCPDDGENWHLNYPRWRCQRVLFCKGIAHASAILTEMVINLRLQGALGEIFPKEWRLPAVVLKDRV